ncbi:MAG TPA: hypothetical protein VNH18_00335 [Bryobacteraceae bacterium]|nr:hypothetical protein [Bryobacteraceae bacterium]
MTDNVIHAEFGAKKPDEVLTCTNGGCGGQKFFLHANMPGKVGEIECSRCGQFLDNRCWGNRD